ncbi:MAG: phytanoyl-CoA dioxygenase family protein [Candidatus Marinimicrobia bacterium]|nr:phytanoyl-CoA dioxygenase family protein [Candidatus Neomarinimicrobiota bacterium]
MITDSQIQEYSEKGAILLKKAFDHDWLSILGEGIEKNRKDPGPYACQYTTENDEGDFYDDYCNWDRFDEYKDFVFNSPAAEIAGQLTRSYQLRIFHEHVLVKEPKTLQPTPWHQDQPYYCVDGEQVCTIWLPLDPVPKQYGLEFVSGSHTWGKMYTPKKFLTHEEYDYQLGSFESIPDIETNRHQYKILSWDLEPGDCIVFHFKTLHGGSGNPRRQTRRRAFASRWIGDDAVYAERPGETSPPFPELKSFKQDDPLDHPLFPICWEAK